MGRILFALLVPVFLASVATSYRIKLSRKRATGKVDALYTFGAPGSASPGFRNPDSRDGCFPGERAWAGKLYLNLSGVADAVPQITHLLGYRHSAMDSAEYDTRGSYTVRKSSCPSLYSQEAPNPPHEYRLVDAILHLRTYYVNGAKKISQAFSNLTDIATIGSYIDDVDYLKARTQALGWQFVALAEHPGNTVNGGPQKVVLAQDKDTLDCLMTFQGTDSFQDWAANFQVAKSHFCGFVDRDEQCTSLIGGQCKVRKAGSSFVHMGFRNHMRRMVQSSDFQTKIRPLLPGCNKLTVGGHSLGGAMSELFTACMANAPRPGAYGYEEDYKYMSFNKGTPRQLW